MVYATPQMIDAMRPGFGRPQLIFFCELERDELWALLHDELLLAELSVHGYGVAVAMRHFDEPTAAAVRLLNQHRIPAIAWLLLSPDEGFWFHLQNYPQAVERYTAFRGWALTHGLHFQAIGLDIEPPRNEVDHIHRWGLRDLTRRAWLARENVLFASARLAYTELIARIHHDGAEVHTYQLPILADDRRAGTSLAQRALDIVDLPADVEVLICYSSAPLDALGNDLGGALVASYGPAADSIAVGVVPGTSGRERSGDAPPPLSWEALERDLLLAARHTDTIYIYSLEGCAQRGLMGRLATIDWDAEARVPFGKRSLVASARSGILLWMLAARFSRGIFAWLGWSLFAVMVARQLRRRARG
ncbi:hypothetical protein [Candidatus Chloroploca sp. Khr17]|uniref:hypothetical protein n=1 Tax=Candidatus Chloroploca sp. Khr17 TaxID=2496869 RepID=UPI001F0F9107|nr:hypothetical protein [Candidatus Chloroploca sp. Khr17]